jgi:predicted nuclease with TOPRIM domain
MEWNETTQTRFNELRYKELSSNLNKTEQEELARLVAVILADEEEYLAPAIARMQSENEARQEQINKLQKENVYLARIVIQQEQLVQDAKHWLDEFERRHSVLQRAYAPSS